MYLGVVLGHLWRLSDLHIVVIIIIIQPNHAVELFNALVFAVKIFNCLGSTLLLTIDFEITFS